MIEKATASDASGGKDYSHLKLIFDECYAGWGKEALRQEVQGILKRRAMELEDNSEKES